MPRNLEEELKYWRANARILPPERERGRIEALERLASVGQVGTALLQVVNILNLLQLYPEFWVFMERIGEIWSMPPEIVREMYPELFYGSITAFSIAAFIHTMIQWAYMSLRKQALPVFRGAWRLLYAVSLAATLTACLITFIIAKNLVALTYLVIFALSLPYVLNPRYDAVIEEINKMMAAGEKR